MSKNIYFIVTKINIKIHWFNGFLRKIFKYTEDGTMLVLPRYVYADSSDNAILLYKNRFGIKNADIPPISEWYYTSDNLTASNIKNWEFNSKSIEVLKTDCSFVNITTLKNAMSAEDFKEWWHNTNG